MNIELSCISCESVLSVDAIHAGKQLRCPTCGQINSIPAGEPTRGNSSGEDEFIPKIAPVNAGDPRRGLPDPDYVPPEYRGPTSAPMSPEQPWPATGTRLPNRNTQAQSEKALGKAYLFFGMGVGVYFVCGCFGVVIAPILFGNGLANASRVVGPSKGMAYTMNVIGFIVSLGIIGVSLLFMVVG